MGLKQCKSFLSVILNDFTILSESSGSYSIFKIKLTNNPHRFEKYQKSFLKYEFQKVEKGRSVNGRGVAHKLRHDFKLIQILFSR